MIFDLDRINADALLELEDYLSNQSPVLMSLSRQPACHSPVRDLGGWMNHFARMRMGRETELAISQSVCEYYGLPARVFYNIHMARGETYRVRHAPFDSLHPEMRKAIFMQVLRKAMNTASADWYGVIRGVVTLPRLNDYVEWNWNRPIG